MREILGLSTWWNKQTDIVESIRDHRRTMVRGCISSSKTYTVAASTLWWLYAFGPEARVFTTAPTYRQVEINMWGEIGKLYTHARVALGESRALLATELKLDRDWYALGFSTDRPDYVHGIHGKNDLLVIDEAQGIAQPMFDAVENMMAGGNTKFAMLCNPTVLSGEVYDAVTVKSSIYNNIKISAYDTPNVKEGRLVIPGMVTKEQVDEWIRVYGRDSNFVRVKVFADFPKQESDTLIPLDWLEKATLRTPPKGYIGKKVGACDVARFGDDDSAMGWREGRQLKGYKTVNGNDTMQVAGRCALLIDEEKLEDFFVDECGLGVGVLDRLNEQAYYVHGINAGEKANDELRFKNLRSEMWWAARESLNPENESTAMCILRDNRLMAELSSVKYKIMSDKRIEVESKEEMKKRLGRSPDVADMYCMMVYHDYMPNAKPAMARGAGSVLTSRVPSWL